MNTVGRTVARWLILAVVLVFLFGYLSASTPQGVGTSLGVAVRTVMRSVADGVRAFKSSK